MTRYDEPPASDGHGGPHPLADVPQAALDAANDALVEWLLEIFGNCDELERHDVTDDDIESASHAVLMAGLQALRK